MTLFGQQPRRDDPAPKPEPRVEPPVERPPLPTPAQPGPVRRAEDTPIAMASPEGPDSILAAGLTIGGKIEGNGKVRVVGQFRGNVNVKGELTIEAGASIDGEVKGDAVLVGGEVRGHIVSTASTRSPSRGRPGPAHTR